MMDNLYDSLEATLGLNQEGSAVEEIWDVNAVLKGKKSPSLEPIQEEIKMARKPRMRTVEQYLCDRCDQVIPITKSPQTPAGFVIHGNIYTANPSQIGGLIGNNFPIEPDKEGAIELGEVKQTVLCKKCLMETLMLVPSSGVRKASEDDIMRDALRNHPGIRVSDR